MTERTPAAFRSIYSEWSERHKSVPDSKIIPPKPRRSDSSRHADLSNELQGLLFWRHITKDIEPLSTNWMVPDNDNDLEKDDDEPRAPRRSMECEHVIRPGVDEMMAGLAAVEFDIRIYNHKVPRTGTNVEYAPFNGRTHAVVRIGTLRFSTQDSVGTGSNISPTRGSLIGWHATAGKRGYSLVDDFGAPLGSDEDDQEDIDSSNQFFADLLNAKPHRYVKSGSCEIGTEIPSFPALPPTSMPINEARSLFGMPPTASSDDNRAALPSGSRRASDSFLGHKITSANANAGGGDSPDEWIVRHQEAVAIRAKLSATDAKVLDTAIHASNFEDIGNAFAFTGKTAQRQGKCLLLAANKNLSALIEQNAA
jgi:hypothetical protein